MNYRMCKLLKISFFIIVLLTISCSGSHAVECVIAEGSKVCFKREVWGVNGDSAWITTNDDRCRKPSAQTDFISDGLETHSELLYKFEGQKLYVFGDRFIKPSKEFPFEVIIVNLQYDPKNPDRNLMNEGFQKIDLGEKKMYSCLSDLF